MRRMKKQAFFCSCIAVLLFLCLLIWQSDAKRTPAASQNAAETAQTCPDPQEPAQTENTLPDTENPGQTAQALPDTQQPGQTAQALPDPQQPGETETPVMDERDLIMVDDILYYDSGEISTDLRCGIMDGQITDVTDGVPDTNQQSNFGTGYRYQYGPNRIDVYIEEEWHIFIPARTE